MKVVFYEGEKIYLRPLEVEDEALCRLWLNDPRNRRTLMRRRPLSKAEETKWLETVRESPNDTVFGVAVQANDRLIGSVGLHRIDWISHAATFGIQIGDVAYQDKGYGTEATKLALEYGFGTLNLHRIDLGVFSNNPRAIRVYEKAGFVLEGRSREAFHGPDGYVDVLRYGVLRREWEAANGEVVKSADARVGMAECTS